jgi:hypothetical protein
VTLQKENRTLTVEDVKMLTRIPSTIWDPLVKQEVINFEVPRMEPSVEQLTNDVKELRKLYHAEKQENEGILMRMNETEKKLRLREEQTEMMKKSIIERYERRVQELESDYKKQIKEC